MIVTDRRELKRFILQHYEQEVIIARLFDIEEADVKYCLENVNHKICNVLRGDKNASLGMMYVRDNQTRLPKIKVYDFANSIYRGDCFDIAGIVFRLNPNIPEHFIAICNSIISIASKKIVNIRRQQDIIIHEKKVAELSCTLREFNLNDVKYWTSRGVTLPTIRTRNVYAALHVFMDGVLIYTHRDTDPCYAYVYGTDPNSNKTIIQFYFPNRKKGSKQPRFITNNYYVFNDFLNYPSGEILILTKSYKDELAFYSTIQLIDASNSLDVVIKSVSNENVRFLEEDARFLQSRYKYIFTNFDYDRAGIALAQSLRKKYGFAPIMFTNGLYNSFNYGAKDYSEYYSNRGIRSCEQLLREAYGYIATYIQTNYDS